MLYGLNKPENITIHQLQHFSRWAWTINTIWCTFATSYFTRYSLLYRVPLVEMICGTFSLYLVKIVQFHSNFSRWRIFIFTFVCTINYISNCVCICIRIYICIPQVLHPLMSTILIPVVTLIVLNMRVLSKVPLPSNTNFSEIQLLPYIPIYNLKSVLHWNTTCIPSKDKSGLKIHSFKVPANSRPMSSSRRRWDYTWLFFLSCFGWWLSNKANDCQIVFSMNIRSRTQDPRNQIQS